MMDQCPCSLVISLLILRQDFCPICCRQLVIKEDRPQRSVTPQCRHRSDIRGHCSVFRDIHTGKAPHQARQRFRHTASIDIFIRRPASEHKGSSLFCIVPQNIGLLLRQDCQMGTENHLILIQCLFAAMIYVHIIEWRMGVLTCLKQPPYAGLLQISLPHIGLSIPNIIIIPHNCYLSLITAARNPLHLL